MTAVTASPSASEPVADPALDADAVQAALVPWILETAPTLPRGSPSVAPRHQAQGEPPHLPVAVTISAWPPLTDGDAGRLRVLRFGDSDTTMMLERRVSRLRIALTTKLPKLLKHKPARTVLVLEDVDLAMSNVSDVWVALQRAALDFELCDTIVVADTAIAPFTGTVVYDEGRWLPDFSNHRFALPATDSES